MLMRLHKAHVARRQKFFPVQKPVFVEPVVEATAPEPVPASPELAPVEEIEAPEPFTGRRRVKQIIRLVGRHYGVSLEEIIGPRKYKYLVLPRQVACFLTRELTLFSLPEIGRQFGKRNHSTIHHGYHKIKARVATDPEFANFIAGLRAELTPKG